MRTHKKSPAQKSNSLKNLPVLFSIFLIPICMLISSPMPALADPSPQIQAWTNEIAKLIDKQDYAQALNLARQTLELNQKESGNDSTSNCKFLNNLGWLCQQNGQYGAARKAFETSMKLSESKQLQDGEYAWALNNLATLLYVQGDFETAKPYYEKALTIYEKLDDAQKTSRTLRNLAGVLDALEKGDEALAAYRRAIELIEKQKTPDQLELAQSLEGLASSLEDKGKFEDCLPLFNRSLSIKEGLLGKDHIELVSLLNNLAVLNLDTGKSSAAKPLLERAIEITESNEGTTHIDLVVLLNNLGDLALLKENQEEAEKHYLHAASIVNSYLTNLLPYCSIAEQYALYKAYSREQISRLLSVCNKPESINAAYKIFFSWKGTLLSSMAKQSEARRHAKSPESKEQLDQLSKLREDLASWYQEAGSVPLKEWKERNQLLTEEKEKLERKVLSADPDHASSSAGLDLSTFQKLLKDNEAIIDIYQYLRMSAGEKGIKQEPHFAAVITCGGSESNAQSFVDLGAAAPLLVKLRQWRNEVLALRMADTSWRQLNDALSKVYDALPSRTTRVWICPDAELARLPWHLVSSKQALLSCQIDSCRELAKLRSTSSKAEPVQTMLLVGDVDFDAGIDKNSKRSLLHFPALPGTSSEAKSISNIARSEHLAMIELNGAAAVKGEVLKHLPSANYVHLATHGFFFNESFVEAARAYHQSNTRSVQLRPKLDANLSRRNPLVESGIALAGANKANEDRTLAKNGILTAEEFIDSDMSNCRFAALSACDTGRGEELTGQGVMGLRASLIAAGARNVLISLWKVPDVPTAELMKDVYANIWTKKMGAAQALKAAQESLRKKLTTGAAQPINWAAWILVGEGW